MGEDFAKSTDIFDMNNKDVPLENNKWLGKKFRIVKNVLIIGEQSKGNESEHSTIS